MIRRSLSMQNQNQQQNLQNSTQMPPQQNEGGHSLFDTHEALGTVTGTLVHYLLYEQHIQDQELTTALQSHRTFISQLYNTLVETLKSGQDPSDPPQTYNMSLTNDVVNGMRPSAPTPPSQSVNATSA